MRLSADSFETSAVFKTAADMASAKHRLKFVRERARHGRIEGGARRWHGRRGRGGGKQNEQKYKKCSDFGRKTHLRLRARHGRGMGRARVAAGNMNKNTKKCSDFGRGKGAARAWHGRGTGGSRQHEQKY